MTKRFRRVRRDCGWQGWTCWGEIDYCGWTSWLLVHDDGVQGCTWCQFDWAEDAVYEGFEGYQHD